MAIVGERRQQVGGRVVSGPAVGAVRLPPGATACAGRFAAAGALTAVAGVAVSPTDVARAVAVVGVAVARGFAVVGGTASARLEPRRTFALVALARSAAWLLRVARLTGATGFRTAVAARLPLAAGRARAKTA